MGRDKTEIGNKKNGTGVGAYADLISKRVVPFFACLALVLFATTAHSASIDVCTVGANIHCDFNENGATSGTINPLTDAVPAGTGIVPGWLVAYTFLLEPGTNYAGAADNGNISDVVVFHNGFAQLFSALDPNFVTQRNNALALIPIDGAALSTGQIVGAPFFPGAQQFGGIGLVNEDVFGVANLVDIFFNGGAGDSITITGSVPEPMTLNLMSIGFLGLGMSLWRSRRGV